MLKAISFLHGTMKRRTNLISEIPEDKLNKFHKVRFLAGHIALLILIMLLVTARLPFSSLEKTEDDVF